MKNPEVFYAAVALALFTLFSTGLGALAVHAVIAHMLGSFPEGL